MKLMCQAFSKIQKEIILEVIKVEDKTFLHKNHLGHQKDKFHLKISIKSTELKICLSVLPSSFVTASDKNSELLLTILYNSIFNPAAGQPRAVSKTCVVKYPAI